MGLYDERSTGFGYFYGSWHVATATWTQVTEVVTAVQTSSIAEFILSVHLTAPDQHIVVDDVLITEGGAIPEVSIHDIQYTTDPSGDSPYFEQLVKTVGIVTAKDQFQSNGTEQNVYYLQDASGPWNGVYVFDYLDNGNVVEIGDEVELIAAVDDLNRDHFVSTPSWVELSKHYSERQCMDLVFTVGQYTQVSMILNSFGVQLDQGQTLDPDLKTF